MLLVHPSLPPATKPAACCAMLKHDGEKFWFLSFPVLVSFSFLPLWFFFSIVSLIFSAFLFLFWFALLFSPHSHPSMSCCLSSEVHCLRFAVWANRRDDLLPHFYLSCPNWTTEEFLVTLFLLSYCTFLEPSILSFNLFNLTLTFFLSWLDNYSELPRHFGGNGNVWRALTERGRTFSQITVITKHWKLLTLFLKYIWCCTKVLSKAFLSFWRNGTRNECNQRAAQVSGW